MADILRVHLDSSGYEKSPKPNKYKNLGGRALSSTIIGNEVPPDCDPLGKHNKLVLAPGILAGTSVPNSGRISIGAKIPLTGGIKDSNSGGSVAKKLARLSLAAVVLEGVGQNWVILKINKNGLSFLPADSLVTEGVNETINLCQTNETEGAAVIAIDQAGEMQLTTTPIGVTSPDNYLRRAGRGGLGAVMGAKKVKAIIIDDSNTEDPTIKDAELFKLSVKKYSKGISAHPLVGKRKKFGISLLINRINKLRSIHTYCNAFPCPTKHVGNSLSASNRQIPVSQFLQHYFAAIDSLGICLFAALPLLDMPEVQRHLIDCVEIILDESLDEQYFLRLGKMVLEEEKQFSPFQSGAGTKRTGTGDFFITPLIL